MLLVTSADTPKTCLWWSRREGRGVRHGTWRRAIRGKTKGAPVAHDMVLGLVARGLLGLVVVSRGFLVVCHGAVCSGCRAVTCGRRVDRQAGSRWNTKAVQERQTAKLDVSASANWNCSPRSAAIWGLPAADLLH